MTEERAETRYASSVRADQLALYKGTGAAKFGILPPKMRKDPKSGNWFVERAGAIFLEAAPSSGRQQWDWSKKIQFAIGVQDICNLVDSNMQADPKGRRLFHDQSKNPNSDSDAAKTLEFEPGQVEGTFMMKLSEKERGGQWSSVIVPVSNGEYQVLMRLLVSSVDKLLGWDL